MSEEAILQTMSANWQGFKDMLTRLFAWIDLVTGDSFEIL